MSHLRNYEIDKQAAGPTTSKQLLVGVFYKQRGFQFTKNTTNNISDNLYTEIELKSEISKFLIKNGRDEQF